MKARLRAASADPFLITPDSRFAFSSSSFESAFEAVARGIELRLGMMALVGPPGCGKTMMLRALQERVMRNGGHAFFHFQPSATLEDLLGSLLAEIRGKVLPAGRDARLRTLSRYLYRLGGLQPSALLVDEAHTFHAAALLCVASLADIQLGVSGALQIVLAGQKSLEEQLQSPELAPLAARIAVTARLRALEADELAKYVAHRLAVARGSSKRVVNPFTTDALEKIFAYSQGVPRNVNRLCACALASKAATIRAAEIEEAAFECGLAPPPKAYQVAAVETSNARWARESTLAAGHRRPGRPGAVLYAASFATVASLGIGAIYLAQSGLDLRSVVRIETTRLPEPALALDAPIRLAHAAVEQAVVQVDGDALEVEDAATAPEPLAESEAQASTPMQPVYIVAETASAEPEAAASEIPSDDQAVSLDDDAVSPEEDPADVMQEEDLPQEAVAPQEETLSEPAAGALDDGEPASPEPPAPTQTNAPADQNPPRGVVAAPEPNPPPVAPMPSATPSPGPETLPSGAADSTAPSPGRAVTPAPMPPPTSPSGPALDADRLMSLGRAHLERGDPATARLFFERAAAQGRAEAMNAVGQTFDPLELQRSGVVGMKGDLLRAMDWYRRAAEAGDQSAVARINRLREWSADRRGQR